MKFSKKMENKNELEIPIKVHVIKSSDGVYSSYRDDNDIKILFNEVNRIWKQANISFTIKEIIIENISYFDYQNILIDLQNLFYITEYESEVINAYFMKNIGGPNGIALDKSLFIADKTSVNDFRATSHELGHILGLVHVNPTSQLMAAGVNGTILADAEIKIARENAIKLNLIEELN